MEPALPDNRGRSSRAWPPCASSLLWATVVLAGVTTTWGQAPADHVTFSRDVAPIIFKHCAECHQPETAAPFDLLSFDDVRKRGRQIVEVTGSRLMPPWPPEAGYGDFDFQRGMTSAEIAVIKSWFDAGMPEGDPAHLPPAPALNRGWALGEPDLILQIGEGYQLPADGPDVYRNFVASIPLPGARFVRAVEFLPDNPRVVHHAFLKVDHTGESRRLDQLDEQPGFAGMNIPAKMPPGKFLTWQPGARPAFQTDGLNWPLEPGTELVAQLHLQPTGKPERVGARVGFHFSATPPSLIAERIALASLTIDIPPGETNYVVEDSFKLPVDAQIVAVLPHAHYLAREMQGYATLPDGRREWLLWIRNWDFNWQGHYQYREPVALPKGSVLHLRYRYDNSPGNPQNPSQPPVPVRYGPNSTNEMAELWFQMAVKTTADRDALNRAYQAKQFDLFLQAAVQETVRNPGDPEARMNLGRMLLGVAGRQAEGVKELELALQLDPKLSGPHYYLGLLHRRDGRFGPAEKEFLAELAINPRHAKALANLGILRARTSDFAGAENYLARAVQADPSDSVAKELLDEVKARRKAGTDSPPDR